MGVDRSPEAHGIPSRAIRTLVDDLEREGLDPHALVVARHGDVVFEGAWRPYRLDQPALVYSVSKTFTSLAIGFLEAEGRIALDDSVGDLLALPNPNGLTVRHLLTMNTGHSPAQIERLDFDVRALLSVPPEAEAGTRFAYNSDATYALSCIVTALTGDRLTDYLRPRLLDPLGIGDRWMKPTRGVEQGFSGFHVTVRDLARVGIVLADHGRLGSAQLLPGSYLDELARPWSDTRDPARPAEDDADDWGVGYGYQVWRNTVGGFRLDGALGQFSVVLPDRGTVIAYQGATHDTGSTLRAFWRFLDAVVDEPLAEDPESANALESRVAALDAWDARGSLDGTPDGRIDTVGWGLGESADGWTLTLPSGHEVAVGADDWARTTLVVDVAPDTGDSVVASPPVASGAHVALDARGERIDGGILVHLVNATSPHRIIVTRRPEGTIDAAWHTAPLRAADLEALAVPEGVILTDLG